MSDLSGIIKKIITDELGEYGWNLPGEIANSVAAAVSSEIEMLYGKHPQIYVEDSGSDEDILAELENHQYRIEVLEQEIQKILKPKKRVVVKRKADEDESFKSLNEALNPFPDEELPQESEDVLPVSGHHSKNSISDSSSKDFSKFADEKGLYGTEPITSIPAAFRPVLSTSKVINRDLENVTLPTVATKWCSECMNDSHNYPDCPPLPKEI